MEDESPDDCRGMQICKGPRSCQDTDRSKGGGRMERDSFPVFFCFFSEKIRQIILIDRPKIRQGVINDCQYEKGSQS